MGEAKHTPGPWVARREDWKGEPVEHKVYIAGDRRECYDDDDDDEGPVEPCHVSTAVAIVEGNRTSGEVTAANAALIVAAPDLLRELRHLVRLIEPSEETFRIAGLGTLDGARAAIAKATGKDGRP